jgi:hypothetical protein
MLCERSMRSPSANSRPCGGRLDDEQRNLYPLSFGISLLRSAVSRNLWPCPQFTSMSALSSAFPRAAFLCLTHGDTLGRARHRKQHAAWLPTQQQSGGRRRRADFCAMRMPRVAAGPFGGLFGAGQSSGGSGSGSGSGQWQQQQPDFLDGDEGGKMLQLDANSSGSLDGSGEEPFGPLVRLLPHQLLCPAASLLGSTLLACLQPSAVARYLAVASLEHPNPHPPTHKLMCGNSSRLFWLSASWSMSLGGCGGCCMRTWMQRWCR